MICMNAEKGGRLPNCGMVNINVVHLLRAYAHLVQNEGTQAQEQHRVNRSLRWKTQKEPQGPAGN
jgi:hypothetical protein